MVILIFYINAPSDAVQKSLFKHPIYGSVVSQDYLMVIWKDGNNVYTIMTE